MTMTSDRLTDERVHELLLKFTRDSYRLNGSETGMALGDAVFALCELQERRKAAIDSEPVVPDEIEADHNNTYDYVDGYNACRAAMLQAGNSPVTPEGSEEKHQPDEPSIDMSDADCFSVTRLHEIIYGSKLCWPEEKLLARFMLDVKQRLKVSSNER